MPKYAEEILAVTELQRHPTAEQVFLEMKKEHPSIALGTVYKHLNGLAEEGLLLRITEPGSPDRYDRTERHDHLICSRCGKIADVHLPDMQSRIEHALGRGLRFYVAGWTDPEVKAGLGARFTFTRHLVWVRNPILRRILYMFRHWFESDAKAVGVKAADKDTDHA